MIFGPNPFRRAESFRPTRPARAHPSARRTSPARRGGDGMTRLLVDHVFAGLPPQAAPAAPGDTPPPAPLAVPATPEAERAWLAEERTRLEAFAAGQFDAIARQRRQ